MGDKVQCEPLWSGSLWRQRTQPACPSWWRAWSSWPSRTPWCSVPARSPGSTSSWESGELHLEICLKDVEDHVCIPIKRNLTQLSHTRRLSASSRTCSACPSPPSSPIGLHEGMAPSQWPGQGHRQGQVSGPPGAQAGSPLPGRELWVGCGQGARKIWCFGPDGMGTSILMDTLRACNTSVKSRIVWWLASSGPPRRGAMREVHVGHVLWCSWSDTAYWMPSTVGVARTSPWPGAACMPQCADRPSPACGAHLPCGDSVQNKWLVVSMVSWTGSGAMSLRRPSWLAPPCL